MRPIPPFTPYQERILRNYYESPLRGERCWTYPRAAGFLFAVACEPEMVPVREWLPLVLGDGSVSLCPEAELEAVTEAFLSLHNWVQAALSRGEAALPESVAPGPDPTADFDSSSPVSEWSNGFLWGSDWAGAKEWHDLIPESLDSRLSTDLMALSFFASRRLAEGFHQDLLNESPETTLESMAAIVGRNLRDCVQDYGVLAFAVRTALSEQSAKTDEGPPPSPSRNAPCPCGSGKKYKACCGKGAGR